MLKKDMLYTVGLFFAAVFGFFGNLSVSQEYFGKARSDSMYNSSRPVVAIVALQITEAPIELRRGYSPAKIEVSYKASDLENVYRRVYTVSRSDYVRFFETETESRRFFMQYLPENPMFSRLVVQENQDIYEIRYSSFTGWFIVLSFFIQMFCLIYVFAEVKIRLSTLWMIVLSFLLSAAPILFSLLYVYTMSEARFIDQCWRTESSAFWTQVC